MLPRLTALLVLAAILLLYHGHGIIFLYWADSSGYHGEALHLLGVRATSTGSGRDLGYPVFLMLPLALPWAALSIVLSQALLVALAMWLLHRHALAAVAALAPRLPLSRPTLSGWLVLALVVVASYSGLHFQVLSVLPDVLFAVLALVAVLAVGGLLRSERPTPGRVVATLVAAMLPLTVKPHWLLAAVVLALVIGWKLAVDSRHLKGPPWLRAAAAFALALLPMALLAGVQALHVEAKSPASRSEAAMFGPRTVFCNHLHLIDDAVRRRPGLRLHADAAIDQAVVAYIRDIRARYKGGWRRLGFDGDLCAYDPGHNEVFARLFPTPKERRRYYLQVVLAAALADPLPFAGKVVLQIWYGIQSTFSRFAIQASDDRTALSAAMASLRLGPEFLAGVRATGEAGPFGSIDRLKHTWPGHAVHVLLAIVFTALEIAFIGLILAVAVLVAMRWRAWPGERRRDVAALVLLPLAVILAHHMLVALTHSFDIWRYAFNTFFLSLAFMLSAALLACDESQPPA